MEGIVIAYLLGVYVVLPLLVTVFAALLLKLFLKVVFW